MFNPLQPRTLAVSGAALPTYGMDGQPILIPVRLQGTETLGRLHDCCYRLTLKSDDALAFSPSLTASLDLDSVIGTEVTVRIEIEGKGHFVPGQLGSAGAGNIGAGVREITGIVTRARMAGEDGRSMVYELELRPWLYLATLSQDCRIFQNMDVMQITDAVLGKYLFPLEKRLYARVSANGYPVRDIQRQAWETDWAFLQRLWEEWGIWWWMEYSDGRARLVLGDALAGHTPHGPAYETIRYVSPTGKRIDEEHIHELSVTSRLTGGRVTLVDYDYTQPRANLRVEHPDPRKTAQADQESYEWADYSQPQAGPMGMSGERNNPQAEAQYLARVRMEARRSAGLRAHGRGSLRGLSTGYTFTLAGYPQQDANREYLVVSCTLDIEDIGVQSGAGQSYRCETAFELHPLGEPFRLERSVGKPFIRGLEKALVVGPAGQVTWTDALGRVKVQFAWDREGQNDEHSGIWLRVVQPWQGANMGTAFIPRIGHEVTVDHYHGDPDLPIVTASVPNPFNGPAYELAANNPVSGFRGQEHHGSQSGQVLIDDTRGQIQTQVASDHGTSQLSLGNLRRIAGRKGRQDARGQGFDLRTDMWGVLRALMGLLISTDGQPGAPGHAKNADEALARLTRARELHESLTELAQQHEAQQKNADQSEVAKAIGAQNDAIRGDVAGAAGHAGASAGGNDFPQLKERHIAMASGAGIGLTAEKGTHIASNEDFAVTAGRHAGIAVGHSFFVSVANAFSLFVHQLGIRLVAASGKIQLEAQSGQIGITAKKGIELSSTTDSIILGAAREIRLRAGDSELVINAEGITGRTQGQFLVHAASHVSEGPQGSGSGFPPLPQSGPGQLEVLRQYAGGLPVSGSAFTVTDSLGAVHAGTLDAAGRALVSGLVAGAVSVKLGKDPHDPWAPGSYQKPPRWKPADIGAPGVT
ncbi:type VI secretion system Vgr family protein [Paraburkholderia hayleyella]|uniref:type VI secretion system Vgr family protein n=1 Tax=Paraburkholderia hayleyella TaxID=2152889 RepID=UPI001292A2E2|nr:type VI secretion system Vgr family protein [Paraburkholderia hayleyella]